jgi:integrase
MDAVIRELEREGTYTVDKLMSRYRSVMTGNTMMAFTEKLATELEQAGYGRTAKAYRTAAARLQRFNSDKDINPEHFTAALLTDFQATLKAEGRSMNTISFYMRTLRAIYHKAIAEGRIARRAESPFSGVYTGVATTRKLALTQGELALLSTYDPTNTSNDASGERETLPEHLGEALAMFLFCYHARGMSFVDMAFLKKSDYRGNTIRYRRHKTGQAIELSVVPAMKRIMDWFAPATAGSKYLFPVITDPDKDPVLQYESGIRLQNQRLKKIAKVCGIHKRFSTHAARHSWATVAKNAGLPLAVISEGLGHTNQHTTEIYLASLERSVLDHASKVVSEAIKPVPQTLRDRPRAGKKSNDTSWLPGYTGGYRRQNYGGGYR